MKIVPTRFLFEALGLALWAAAMIGATIAF